MEELKHEVKELVKELLDNLNLEEVRSIVLGCSSSEVIGKRIGKATSQEVGEVIVCTLKEELNKHHIDLVVQGCEHINRALVVEREYAIKNNLEQVNVRPVLSAGGGAATAAFNYFHDPVMVEQVQVEAGIDIGQTLIGMHIKRVAIPLRLNKKTIGQANVACAKRRAKLIGGARAQYQENI